MRRPYKHIDLGDKFAEFEHTPDDSNWNSISGGINSRQQPGGLADKFSDFEVAPDKKVWAGIMAGAEIKKPSRRAAFWWTSGVAASAAALLLWSVVFSANEELTAYTPRENGQTEQSVLNGSDKLTEQTVEFTDPSPQGGTSSSVNSDLITEHNSNSAHQNTQTKGGSLAESALNQSGLEADSNGASGDSTVGNSNEALAVQNKSKGQFSKSGSGTSEQQNYELDNSTLAHSEYTPAPETQPSDLDTVLKFSIIKNEYKNPEESLYAMRLEPKEGSLETDTENNSEAELKGNTQPVFFFEDFRIPSNSRNGNASLLASSQLSNASAANDGLSNMNSISGFNSASPDALVLDESTASAPREEFATPVYITIQLEKRLNLGAKKRLSISSGLGALFMNSTLNADFQNFTTEAEIRRNYGVLPLYAKYDFIKKPKWNMYLTSGGALELGLGGKRTVTDYENGEEVASTTSRFKLGLGQVNINASLGSSINLGTHLSAFAEVSAAHYVYQSQYNFWSSQKLWPSLKTGISLKL